MADFTFFSNQVPGHKMCMICFEYIPIENLFVDAQGQKWDTCKPCEAKEQAIKLAKENK